MKTAPTHTTSAPDPWDLHPTQRQVSVGILSTYPPTQCGLATFASALANGLRNCGVTEVGVVACGDDESVDRVPGVVAAYAVDSSRVVTVPHGATITNPVAPTSDSSPLVLTWGLLGPGKGIESLVTFDSEYRTLGSLMRLVSRSSCVVLPYESIDQITSGVLVDAVAAGRPVIATAFPHAIEPLSDGAGILVPPRNPEVLARAIRRVATDPVALRSMSARAAALAPMHNWVTVANSYRNLGLSLLPRRGNSAVPGPVGKYERVTQHPLKLRGALGSPYSLKMRAVLRYRRIPFRWVPQGSAWDDLPPFPLIPVIGFPDADGHYGDAQMDSSPLIMRLESMFEGRSLVPADPVVAFIDYLVEDFADEWLTKAMYHYRWYYDEAIDKAKHLLPLDRDQQTPAHQWERAQRFISERQIGRRALVGSTEQNRAPIEESFVRLLGLLENLLAATPFLFGARPSRGDFGLFGQLVQLLRWDPVSVRIGIEHAPRLVNWVDRTDDLSWWEVDDGNGWAGRDSIPAETLALLPEIGRTYAPFLLANDAAIAAGDETFSCVIDGHPYSQGTFVYQRKCLAWLREQHASLSPSDRAAVNAMLAGTGCEVLFG